MLYSVIRIFWPPFSLAMIFLLRIFSRISLLRFFSLLSVSGKLTHGVAGFFFWHQHLFCLDCP